MDPVPDPTFPEKFLGYSKESNPGPLDWQSDIANHYTKQAVDQIISNCKMIIIDLSTDTFTFQKTKISTISRKDIEKVQLCSVDESNGVLILWEEADNIKIFNLPNEFCRSRDLLK